MVAIHITGSSGNHAQSLIQEMVQMTEKRKLIFAGKHSNDQFGPETLVEDLNSFYGGLEYGDVFEGECQIWEYPSGKIYQIEADRQVTDKKLYYSPPADNRWSPVLREIGTDKDKVELAYRQLSGK